MYKNRIKTLSLIRGQTFLATTQLGGRSVRD